MLSLSLIFHKRAGGCYSSRCSHFRGEDFPHKDKSVCVIRGDQSETAERWFMVYLKGTWSHDEAFNQPTDVYRFVSLLQCSTVYSVTCKVIQRDGYALLDGGERACCCGGFFRLLYIIWSLKTQSSMLKVSDVLVHFMFTSSFLFFGKATPSLQKNNNNNKKKQFGFTMTSVHEIRKKKKHCRAEVEYVSVTKPSNTSFYLFYYFFFLNDSFCNP